MTNQTAFPDEPAPRFIRYEPLTIQLPAAQVDTIDSIAESMKCSPDRVICRLIEAYERYTLTHEKQGRGPAIRPGQWLIQFHDPYPTLPVPVSERRERQLNKQASLERHPGTAENYLTSAELEQRQHRISLSCLLPENDSES